MLPLSRVTVRCAVGYMLETPSIRWYSSINVSPAFRVKRWAVKIHPVRTISRKDRVLCIPCMTPGILRDHTPTLFPVSGEEDDMARTLRRRREVDGDVNPPLRM